VTFGLFVFDSPRLISPPGSTVRMSTSDAFGRKSSSASACATG
jgi:hypothetical protein